MYWSWVLLRANFASQYSLFLAGVLAYLQPSWWCPEAAVHEDSDLAAGIGEFGCPGAFFQAQREDERRDDKGGHDGCRVLHLTNFQGGSRRRSGAGKPYLRGVASTKKQEAHIHEMPILRNGKPGRRELL